MHVGQNLGAATTQVYETCKTVYTDLLLVDVFLHDGIQEMLVNVALDWLFSCLARRPLATGIPRFVCDPVRVCARKYSQWRSQE